MVLVLRITGAFGWVQHAAVASVIRCNISHIYCIEVLPTSSQAGLFRAGDKSLLNINSCAGTCKMHQGNQTQLGGENYQSCS